MTGRDDQEIFRRERTQPPKFVSRSDYVNFRLGILILRGGKVKGNDIFSRGGERNCKKRPGRGGEGICPPSQERETTRPGRSYGLPLAGRMIEL